MMAKSEKMTEKAAETVKKAGKSLKEATSKAASDPQKRLKINVFDGNFHDKR